MTVAVPDEGVEEEHGDPRGDDERGGQAIQPPPPPVSGGLRPRALLLRRRRSPQKGSPRPLHSFLPFPLPASPHIRARPRVRGEGIRPAPSRNGRESEPRRPARGGAGRGRVAPGGGWGVFKRPEELHQGERKREALLCCSARDLVGFVFPFALCESCNLSVQPVLRWIPSIAWIVRVVYSLQHLEPSCFVFEIQILNQLFNSPCSTETVWGHRIGLIIDFEDSNFTVDVFDTYRRVSDYTLNAI